MAYNLGAYLNHSYQCRWFHVRNCLHFQGFIPPTKRVNTNPYMSHQTICRFMIDLGINIGEKHSIAGN